MTILGRPRTRNTLFLRSFSFHSFAWSSPVEQASRSSFFLPDSSTPWAFSSKRELETLMRPWQALQSLRFGESAEWYYQPQLRQSWVGHYVKWDCSRQLEKAKSIGFETSAHHLARLSAKRSGTLCTTSITHGGARKTNLTRCNGTYLSSSRAHS